MIIHKILFPLLVIMPILEGGPFPGAQGHGKYTTGGRGVRVRDVNRSTLTGKFIKN
jgi:hypothetical protein